MKKLLLVLMFCSSATMAADCKYDGSVLDMNECAKRDYKKVDIELNEVYYDKVLSLKTPAEKNTLLAIQRDWLKYRDAKCKLKTENGSIATIEHLTCLQSLTKARTLELRR